MTSYQKLKAENKRLKLEIDIIVNEPTSPHGMLLTTIYKRMPKQYRTLKLLYENVPKI